jgi:NAD(P)-dependent dehydrogenase (short-subunit alcohol dehydrogenase family)
VEFLKGRTAVITGAASGIGFAIAEAFLAEGMHVVISDVNESALAVAVERLRSRGGELASLSADVRSQEAVDRLAAAAVDRFGALHVAVNNAGIVNGGKAWELSLDDWRAVLDINLWGVIHGVRSFVPRILASGTEGHVVNTASLAAVSPVVGIAPYTVAKHGVLGLSDVLRLDLQAIDAPVGVSVVMPGRIRTGMNPLGTVDPATVALNVVDAIRGNRHYVFTDDHSRAAVDERLSAIMASRDEAIGHSGSRG